MTNNHDLQNWGRLYTDERTVGHAGWSSEDSYKLKQSRISDALVCHAISPPATFLELGCGAGNVTLWMAGQGYNAYGIDLAPEGIDWAQDRAKGINCSAKFIVGDLADMSGFDSDYFDVVFDADCIHMIIGSKRQDTFAEVYRTTKPGGLFIAGGNVGYANIQMKVKSGQEKRLFFDTDNQCFILNGDPKYNLKYIHRTEKELAKEIEYAGFRIRCVQHHPKRGNASWIKDSIAIHAVKP